MWSTLYTDASWMPKQKTGGWAFWAKSGKGRIVESGKCPKWVKCNNEAEMCAIIMGTKQIISQWGTDLAGILVCTDSTTSIDYLRFRPNGTKELNRKDWLKIRKEYYDLFSDREIKIKFRHVKGHQWNKTQPAWLNNKVDELSRKKI